MAKRGKMAGDGSSKRRSISARPGPAGSIRDELNFLFDTQGLKKKKDGKRSSKPKPRARKSTSLVKGTKNAIKKRNDFTASETLSKKTREKAQMLEQECSDDEEQHSMSQIRNVVKPSASKRAVVSRVKQLKRFSIPADPSPSSSLTSLSQGSDFVPGSSPSQSCSSVSGWASGSACSQQGRSRPRYQTSKMANPSTSGQTSRPKFKRRNSPHPRLLKAKRAKTHKCVKRSRSASTISSASKISNASQRQVHQDCAKPVKRGAKLKKIVTNRTSKRDK